MELGQCLCDVSIFIYLFILYIEINNNSKSYTLHAQEIQFPSDIFPVRQAKPGKGGRVEL